MIDKRSDPDRFDFITQKPKYFGKADARGDGWEIYNLESCKRFTAGDPRKTGDVPLIREDTAALLFGDRVLPEYKWNLWND